MSRPGCPRHAIPLLGCAECDRARAREIRLYERWKAASLGTKERRVARRAYERVSRTGDTVTIVNEEEPS